jgi:ATP-dependent RNA helicase DeaD
VYDGYLSLAGQIRHRTDADDLVAFLLKYFFTHHRMERAQAEAQSAAPPREERPRRERAERERPERERAERRRDRERERREPKLEGAERRERRTPHADLEPAPGQVKLWIGLGTADDLDEPGVRRVLESLGAPVASVSSFDLRPHFSFAIVPEAEAPAFEALTGMKHGEKVLKVERARPKGERAPRERHETRPPEPAEEPGQARLWVSLGKSEGLDEAGVQHALEAAGAPPGKIIRVLLRPTFSYVVVPEENVAAFEAISGTPHGEKTLKVERARARR